MLGIQNEMPIGPSHKPPETVPIGPSYTVASHPVQHLTRQPKHRPISSRFIPSRLPTPIYARAIRQNHLTHARPTGDATIRRLAATLTLRTGDPLATGAGWASSLPPPPPAAAARRGPQRLGRNARDCGARREGGWRTGRMEEEAVPVRASIESGEESERGRGEAASDGERNRGGG